MVSVKSKADIKLATVSQKWYNIISTGDFLCLNYSCSLSMIIVSLVVNSVSVIS